MSELRSAVGPVPDRVVTAKAFLPIPPAEAFRYFTETALLQSWLTVVAEVEPRVGGRYELYWDPDHREDNSTIGCRITAMAWGQFIAFQWRSPKPYKGFANAADPLTHVVVMVVPEDGGTRVNLVHSGWRSGSEWEEARLWQERAWQVAFRALEDVGQQ